MKRALVAALWRAPSRRAVPLKSPGPSNIVAGMVEPARKP